LSGGARVSGGVDAHTRNCKKEGFRSKQEKKTGQGRGGNIPDDTVQFGGSTRVTRKGQNTYRILGGGKKKKENEHAPKKKWRRKRKVP